jgi:hypothetical protein
MDDDVEVYENCFCFTRKVKEYSEPISYIHKIDDKTLQTSQPIIKSWVIVKTPLDSKVGNKIKLAKTDEESFGLILFSSNRYKRFLSTEGDIYYATYVELIDLRTQIV